MTTTKTVTGSIDTEMEQVTIQDGPLGVSFPLQDLQTLLAGQKTDGLLLYAVARQLHADGATTTEDMNTALAAGVEITY